MILRAVLWLGGLLVGRSKKNLGGIASIGLLVIVGLLVAFGVRSCQADRRAHQLDQARAALAVCNAVNDQNARDIEAINEQAAANARAAELERARAERAARELTEQQESADARHVAELEELRDALAADDCGQRPAPDGVDRLFRTSPARPD